MRHLRIALPSLTARARRRAAARRTFRTSLARSVEPLEPRSMLATFSVTNLANSGAGSLREAIQSANTSPGADVIAFDVAGTIALRSALPAFTGPVTVDGGTAPGFVTAPVDPLPKS